MASPAIATFEQAQTYLLGTINETQSRRTEYKLDRMRALLRELGDPQRAYPTIHVGGTSGKGSTATMIASVLRSAGRRTGLHTKPHLRSPVERACIDGAAVSEERFTELLDEMMPAIERVCAEFGRPTYYETLLALAFSHFARERVDVGVIEVGLGGRLDGTNVILPEVAAITSIGYDHTDVLGETLEAIAFEKAGIAKPGVPLVVGEGIAETALAVIVEYAGRVGAPVVRVCDETPLQRYEIRLALMGAFQRRNASTAITILEQLPGGLRPDRAAIARGFEQLVIPGRMEMLPGRPVTIFDIAHNPQKAEALVASLRETFARRRVHYVVAIGATKDAKEILRALAGIPSTFTFTSFDAGGRPALAPQRLAAIAESLGTWGRVIADPLDALAVARRTAGADDVVVVTGSTFLVATLREWYAPTAAL
jgi:dihydrofolate synthase/folylpolyglutamate synthase